MACYFFGYQLIIHITIEQETLVNDIHARKRKSNVIIP